jgi:23S rRNA (guanosine2251-2'-O)-methyltransferase
MQVTNLARTLRELGDRQIRRIGTDGQAPVSIFEADLRGSIAVIMGAEGRGLRRLTRENCDLLVSLPMLGAVESLNVSVSTGICLYAALGQRVPDALASDRGFD